MSNTRKSNVYRMTGLAILSAIIIVLQVFTTFVRFGPFSITLALIPIVVGAAMYGVGAGAYLGAVFSAVVIIMCITGGDVGGFMVWSANPFMCIVMCMLKGTMAGLCAGAVYKALKDKNKLLAVIMAALVSPIVNTGIFIIGMLLFFRETLAAWAGGSDLLSYIILGLTGVNFLIELGVNMILSPVVVKIIDAVQKSFPQIGKEEQNDSHAFQYIISFIVPLVGYILGAILLSKDDAAQKGVGKNCILIAIGSTVLFSAIAVLTFVL